MMIFTYATMLLFDPACKRSQIPNPLQAVMILRLVFECENLRVMKPNRKDSTSCYPDVQFSDEERADSVYLSLTVVNKSCLKCSSPCRPPPFPMLIACVNSYLLSFPVKLGETQEECHTPRRCLGSHALTCTHAYKWGTGRKRKRETTLECYISLKSTRRQNRPLHNPQAVYLKIRLERRQDQGETFHLISMLDPHDQ